MLQFCDNFVTFPLIGVKPRKFYHTILRKSTPKFSTFCTKFKILFCAPAQKEQMFESNVGSPIKRTPKTSVNPRKLYYTLSRKSSTFWKNFCTNFLIPICTKCRIFPTTAQRAGNILPHSLPKCQVLFYCQIAQILIPKFGSKVYNLFTIHILFTIFKNFCNVTFVLQFYVFFVQFVQNFHKTGVNFCAICTWYSLVRVL